MIFWSTSQQHLHIVYHSKLSIIFGLQRDQEFSLPGFPGWDFAKSLDPRIFRDGISLKFPEILPKKYEISLDFPLSAKIWSISFLEDILFVNYIRQTKVSSIPSYGKQQERAGVQCCWQSGDPKKSLPHTRKSRSLSYCQIQPWLRDMGFQNKWEVNVWLIDWFLFVSQNQSLLVHVEYYLLKNQKFKKRILTLL